MYIFWLNVSFTLDQHMTKSCQSSAIFRMYYIVFFKYNLSTFFYLWYNMKQRIK